MQDVSLLASARRARLSLAALAIVALTITAPPLLGQHADSAAVDHGPPPECFRFAFGAWDPPLDWERAGHGYRPMVGEPGAHGRENAARTREDEPLLLFPSFWPVGVVIRFDSAAGADTLRGTATALQADGSRPAPRSRVVAVRMAC